MTDRTTARANNELGGDGLPARIASRTVKRVLRRVEVKAPAKSTGTTTQLATRMCQGFAAIVGEPSRVSALDAARRGARIAPSAKPRAAATRPRAADSSAKTIPTWRGVKAGGLQQPDLTVLFAGAGADEDSDDDEGDDQEQDGEDGDDHLCALSVAQRVVALVLPGLEVETLGPRGRCRKACRRPLGERRSR
jgi:hypothetical protein